MNSSLSVSYINEAEQLEEKRPIEEVLYLNGYHFRSVRKMVAYKGQGHMPGYFWMAQLNRLVEYESRLEMSVLLQLDYLCAVSNVHPQPFFLHFSSGKKEYMHVPDFFVWHQSGKGHVLDVKPKSKLDSERNERAFGATRDFCNTVGWDYSIHSEPPPTFWANLKWLAGFRRIPPGFGRYSEQLIERCSESPQPINTLVPEVGPACLVRPVLFHLLWRRTLGFDMTARLTNSTLITLTGGIVYGI